MAPPSCPGSENPGHRAPGKLAGPGGQGPQGLLLTGLFLARVSDLQSTRPRAETKPAEELRSWEKKQRAPLRYGGLGGGWPGPLSTSCAPARGFQQEAPSAHSAGAVMAEAHKSQLKRKIKTQFLKITE